MSWTEKQARALAEQILSYSKSPECELSMQLTRTAHTRFAGNDITTAGSIQDLRITITSRGQGQGGGRSGSTTVSDTSAETLQRAVALSEELMSLAPEDPEFVPGLPSQRYPTVQGFFPETARAGAAERRAGVKAALDLARKGSLQASGFFENGSRYLAVANKKGNFGFHSETTAEYSTTMRTPDGSGSGWSGGGGPRLASLAPGRMAAVAAKKARTSAGAGELAPGRYPVILEPQAVSDLLGNLRGFMDARSADEGRSYFSRPGGGNRLGEKLFADMITVRADPFDVRLPASPWSSERLPAEATALIEDGVLRTLPVSRYWAQKTNQSPRPASGNLIMKGGKASLEQLIAGADKALLVTRLWYIRTVNPTTIQLTGLTRDGVWLVERGKVVRPVNNFRFNESVPNLLKNAEALGESVSTGSAVVPAMYVREFNFSSRSDAV